MKIVTSPAKLMNINLKTDLLKLTTPVFNNDADFIQSYLKLKDPKYLQDLMEISPKLADENWQRNQDWKANPTDAESTAAIMAFTGEVYRGLDAATLDQKSINYLEKNYRILSGLYGLLKPSDRVMLYRLEMGRPFQFDAYKNLYAFWKEKVTEQLNSELTENDFVVMCASTEYGKVIDRKKLKCPVVDIDFKEFKDGKLKTIVVYTKHARGLVVRYCAENNVKTLDELKAFNYEGYRIDEENSTDKKLLFVR